MMNTPTTDSSTGFLANLLRSASGDLEVHLAVDTFDSWHNPRNAGSANCWVCYNRIDVSAAASAQS
jgi:hypothetical protein